MILPYLNNTKKLYSFSIEQKNKQIDHLSDLLMYYELVKDTNNTRAKEFFYKAIQQQYDKINNTYNDIDKLYFINNKLFGGYYNQYFNVLTNIKEQLRKIKFIIQYQKDLNNYILLNKQQSIYRKTDIPHLIEKMFYKRYITKNQYRKYKKYGYISNEIKQRINIYLRNTLLKVGHKKHYNSLMENRKTQNLFYVQELKQNIKIRKHINPLQFKKELLFKELNDRRIMELKYNVYRL